MKFTADRKRLLNATKIALRAVGNRKDFPEIGGVLVDADEGTGTLFVTGTDSHTQIQCRFREGHILSGGAALLSPRVVDMLRLLSEDTVSIELDGKVVVIQSGSTQFTVPTMDVQAFPKTILPFPEDTICIRNIQALVRRTAVAADNHPQEPNKVSQQFIKLSFECDHTTAEATNGCIAAITESPHGADGKLDLILHEKALQILTDIVGASDELYVGVVGNCAVFMKEDLVFTTTLYTGSYFNGSKLVEAIRPVYQATVDAKELYALTLNVTTLFTPKDDHCVDLYVTEDRLILQTQTGLGVSRAAIPAVHTTPTPSDGFHYHPQWLQDCLRQTSGSLTLRMDAKGFLLIEANRSRYFISPRGPVNIFVEDPKAEKANVKPKSKTRSKTKSKSKCAA